MSLALGSLLRGDERRECVTLEAKRNQRFLFWQNETKIDGIAARPFSLGASNAAHRLEPGARMDFGL